jgi:hypothetical protein
MAKENGKNQTPAEPVETGMSEAPYSVNFLARNPNGFEMQFTLRATSEDALFERVESLTARLTEAGFEPIGRSYGRSESKSYAAPRATEPPKPVEPAKADLAEPLFEDAWTGGELEAEAPQDSPSWCPIHNVEMRRYERSGEVWYSHKAQGDRGEYWCKGKPPRAAKP